MEWAVKHFIIAANMGEEVSMKALWNIMRGDWSRNTI
jgi:hypothetical protein